MYYNTVFLTILCLWIFAGLFMKTLFFIFEIIYIFTNQSYAMAKNGIKIRNHGTNNTIQINSQAIFHGRYFAYLVMVF